jgi:hypothetical protein
LARPSWGATECIECHVKHVLVAMALGGTKKEAFQVTSDETEGRDGINLTESALELL